MTKSCAITSVLIGRDFTLKPLLNYFKNVIIPQDIEVNLYLVLGCDETFTQKLKHNINELKLNDKFNNINYIEGYSKCNPDLDWDQWEEVSRKIDHAQKHRAALENINIALESAKHETYIHFVDDDTIPPNNTLTDLLTTYQKVPNCGIASGIYFNKTWEDPTIAIRNAEYKRKIVASIKKEEWMGCSIDDLIDSNYQDIGFVGNGCILVSGHDVQQILPLNEFREQADDVAPPDFIICRRIRRLNKIISIVPSVVAQHLDHTGSPVGLTPEYLEGIKNSNTVKKILIIDYDKYFNYKALSKDYDQVFILNYIELNNKIKNMDQFNNIKVIEKSIKSSCETYSDPNNYLKLSNETMLYERLDETYQIINQIHNYQIYTFYKKNKTFAPVNVLDSQKLKKLLNQKP